MKKALILPLVIIALTAVSFINPSDTIVGRWQQTVRGATALLVFRADNTFDIFVNGKVFTSGTYTVRQDTFALADSGCNPAYFGSYKLNFFATDSVRFTAIADTCKGRRGSMHNSTVGRRPAEAVKAVKP